MKKTIMALMIITFLAVTGCKLQNSKIIHFPVTGKNALEFEKYKDIFFENIKIKSFTESYDPSHDIKNFFINEFSKAIDRDITMILKTPETEEKTGISKPSLVIGGELTLKITKRSIIEEKKKKKKFVKVENWEMEMKIFFRDTESGKKIFYKTLKSTLNSADPKKPDYNFKFLFREITEKFIRGIRPVGKIERRYLLTK